jgi:uridine kinase
MAIENGEGAEGRFEATAPQPVSPELGLADAEQRIREKLTRQERVLVAIAGGSATGKSDYFTPYLSSKFPHDTVLNEDDYCIGAEASAALHGTPNLYVPQDYDPGLMITQLSDLKRGFTVNIPQYSFEQSQRLAEAKPTMPTDVIIVEGCYLLQSPVRDIFDVRLFVNTDDHSRFIRHLLRPPRNPAQPDGQRIQEFCEMSYACYQREIAPFATEADIIANNPYSPQEALNRLPSVRLMAGRPHGAITQRQYYRHPNMAPTEQLSVALTEDGDQLLEYLPDIHRPEIQAGYQVPVGEYRIDLTKIGYSVES